MTEVTSGGVPAENPFSLSQEESIVPDTPPRSEGNQETLAVKAKENEKVTISKKGLAQLLQIGDALAEKVSTEATVAADAIQQGVEQTRLKAFDLHAFASQGVGGIERFVSIIARVIFKINPEQLQDCSRK